jgi:NAD(P)-dependent dehydrogenase (short-subunit alcohol dehydrogenase family)
MIGCHLDITDESSFELAVATLPNGFVFDYVIVASGILHASNVQPEKTIKSVSKSSFMDVLSVNTVGPALVMKYFLPLLRPHARAVMAIMSARVGSISDNRLGGWYAYRASKSAVNMVIKTAAIEQARVQKQHIIIGIHPGSVDTALSKPFQSRSQYHFQDAELAAAHIDTVLSQCDVASSGKVFDWKGNEVLP